MSRIAIDSFLTKALAFEQLDRATDGEAHGQRFHRERDLKKIEYVSEILRGGISVIYQQDNDCLYGIAYTGEAA